MAAFASAFTTAVMGGIGLAMAVMFVVAVCALMHRAAMGGAQEYSFFNLGTCAAKWSPVCAWNIHHCVFKDVED